MKFKTQTELSTYMWDSFKEKFGDVEFEESKETLKFETLEKYTVGSDFNVEPVTLAEVYSTLKNFTEKMKDGNWNLFLVDGSVVHAFWSSGDRKWRVGALASEWLAGNRVFSRNLNLDVDKIDLIEPLTLDKAIAICKKAGIKCTRTRTEIIIEEL